MNRKQHPASLLYFYASILIVTFTYGVAVGKFHIFPYKILKTVATPGITLFKSKIKGSEGGLPFYYKRVESELDQAYISHDDSAYKGLNLITRFGKDDKLSADIIDMDGQIIHRWNVDWFDIWTDVTHLRKAITPKSRPGTHLHGAVLMKNGDIVFNFSHLGLVRLAPDGNVLWRLPYQTHHSVHLHSNGNLWVCGQRPRTTRDPNYPMRSPPYDEYTILEISPDGEIINEWVISEILFQNGYHGLLHTGSSQHDIHVRDDRLHLNDVEPFPVSFAAGFFTGDDVLVSLRNINAVLVLNLKTRTVKFVSIGRFIWQHDPDWYNGDSFTVFDNNFSDRIEDKWDNNLYSRIVLISAQDPQTHVIYQGTDQSPFFSGIMGKHQWLPNGNLLITETMNGRAFEVNADGRIVWEYINYVDEGIVGIVQEVQRVPLSYAQWYSN